MPTLAEWRNLDADPLQDFFAKDGSLAAASGDHYRYSPLQHRYAQAVRKCCVAGLDNPGMVTILEADPGTGKTKGYGGAAFIHAALTGRRVHVSTFTNYLKRQIGAGDGPDLLKAVKNFTGVRMICATQHSYFEFASPTRASNLAASIEAQEKGPTPESRALRDLAAWTEQELENAEDADPRTIVAEGRGLVATWEEENADIAADLPRESAELWAIDASDKDEMFIKRLYDEAVASADVILSSHAATIIDVKRGGRMFGGAETPFAATIIDEADRMADAARLVMSEKLSLRTIERTLLVAADTVEAMKPLIKPSVLAELESTIASHAGLFAELTQVADDMSERNAKSRQYQKKVAVTGDETWIALLVKVYDALGEIADELSNADVPELRPLSEVIERRAGIVEEFLKATSKDQAERRNAAGKPFVSFSPVNSEPSLMVDAKFAGRMLSRMWNGTKRNGNRPFSDAVILTSATAAQPGARGAMRWRILCDQVGLNIGNYVRLNAGGCDTFTPDKFAELSFVFADPAAPTPTVTDDETPDASLRYQAAMIAEAASRYVDGRCNVLALTTSFRDAAHLERLLIEMGLRDRLIVRGRGMSLRKAVARFRQVRDPILVTPGAWEGFDMPGMIDHLVICRLPWAPPDDEFGRALSETTEDDGFVASKSDALMMARLKQGIGRATRRFDDRAVVWIADPRFPLPPAIEERILSLTRFPRNRSFHECVPVRFRGAMARGEVFMMAGAVREAAE